MANRNLPWRHVPRSPHFDRELATEAIPWIHSPRWGWECKIDHLTLAGGSQATVVTLGSFSAGNSGEYTFTFSGGPLGSPVVVSVLVDEGDSETTAADAMEVAVEALIATTLAGVVVSANNVAGVTTVVYEAGIGLVTLVPTWVEAQRTTASFANPIEDGDYAVVFTGGPLGSPVTATTSRTGGVPATAIDLAIAQEATIEALIPTTLADVVVSANDDGAGLNTVIFEPGIALVAVTSLVPLTIWDLTFGGTATNGNYDFIFTHPSLPGGSYTLRVTRAAGVPITNADLAAQAEIDIEADSALFGIIESANAVGAVNSIRSKAGVTGLVVTTAAPSPGTLTPSAVSPRLTILDATPTAPALTVANSTTLDLNSIAFDGGFPSNQYRSWCLVNVITRFGAGVTLTVGDLNEPAGVLGSTPIDLNATGRSSSVPADAEYQPQPELAWVPTATIDLGAAPITDGEVRIAVLTAPNLRNS